MTDLYTQGSQGERGHTEILECIQLINYQGFQGMVRMLLSVCSRIYSIAQGAHSSMAGKYNLLRHTPLLSLRFIGHDINYIALSGILSVSLALTS
jgi:hypothetical protein